MLPRVLVAVPPTSPAYPVLVRPREALVTVVAGESELWRKMRTDPFDLVLFDSSLVEGPPSELVEALIATPDPPEVVVLGHGDDEQRALALAAGARAALDPGLSPELLAKALDEIVQRRSVEVARAHTRRRDDERSSRLADFASESPIMRAFLSTVRRVVDVDSTLLVQGETGVGKEYLARAIHSEGPRRHGPFVAVNCAALPEGLLESELFGHTAGAFTGAAKARRGYFEQADKGLLFLDEVGELPPAVQVKLLRVLQDRRVQPVGSEREVPVDVRLVAATNRDLKTETEEGRFRSDLFYRLSVVTLEVPPLRERPEDLRSLAESQTQHLAQSLGRAVEGVTPEALAAMAAYPWPGNVRELINVVERAVLLTRGDTIDVSDLPEDVRRARTGAEAQLARTAPDGAPGLGPYREARDRLLEAHDRRYFSELLTLAEGRIGRAAALSGLTPRTVFEKLRRLGLRKEEFRARPSESLRE